MSQNPETTDGVQQPVTMLVVDDHGLFQAGICSELAKYPQQVQIVGKVATMGEAIAAVTRIKPQMVLLDVHLPDGHDGGNVEVAAAPGNEATKLLTFSVSDTTEGVVAVIRVETRGYVTKTTSTPNLVDSIVWMAKGDAAFSPRLAGFVLDAFGATHSETVETDNEFDSLTSRKFEVTRLIARGYTYEEITSGLYISMKTVEGHVSAVLRKLQLFNRYELSRWATGRRTN